MKKFILSTVLLCLFCTPIRSESIDCLWIIECRYGPENWEIRYDHEDDQWLIWHRVGSIVLSRHPTKIEQLEIENMMVNQLENEFVETKDGISTGFTVIKNVIYWDSRYRKYEGKK